MTEITGDRWGAPTVWPTMSDEEQLLVGLKSYLLKDFAGYVVADRVLQLDTLFMDEFQSSVPAIDINDVVVPMRRRGQVPETDKFSLLPIVDSFGRTLSEEGCAYGNTVPNRIRTTYREVFGGRPCLDTSRAIGLVYKPSIGVPAWLVAVAGGFVDKTGCLSVVQLQDVSGCRSDDPDFKHNGLRNGIDWRATLVQGYERVARMIGARGTAVVSHVYSQYDAVQRLGKPGYDDVAARLGYLQLANGNWLKPV